MEIARKLLARASTFGRAVEPAPIDGWVDAVERALIRGWAADLKNPHVAVTVDIHTEHGVIASAVADRFRPDLRDAGIGIGHHGFECRIPPEWLRKTPATATARVRGTSYELRHGRGTEFVVSGPFIQFVALDIVNNCNLRCPFCLVDYSLVDHTELMPEETFAKVLELLPAVEDQGFWLSCLHEPTLHPRMNRLIEMIPAAHRKKTWFTTNLARPLADEVFIGWAESGLHHINISLDTLDEELFAKLRKFGRFGVFKDNLDRLTSIFAARPQAPELRYITMALKPNLHEIVRVVEYSREHWLAIANEIRYTYKYSHMNEQFHREYSLEKHDWEYLDEVLGALRYPCTIERPPEGEEVTVSMNYDLTRGSQIPQIQKHERPLRLRARPNGNMLLIDWEGRFSANINSLDKPLDYFRQF